MPVISMCLGSKSSKSPDLLRKASIDTGASMSCMSEAAFQRDKHTLLQHGKVFRLEEPMTITMFGGQQVQATHTLRSLRVHIGGGWYQLDMLIVPGAMHEYLLAGDFLVNHDAYVHYRARRLNLGLEDRQRDPGAPHVGGYQSVFCDWQHSYVRQSLVAETTEAGGAASSLPGK